MKTISIKDYIIGDKYTRDEIMSSFKVSGQSGMMRSKATNTLVLISNHSKELYSDDWNGGIMHYTGMGRVGDQDLRYSQNRTLLESNSNGITVHFFEIFDDKLKRKYVYDGVVKLVGKPFPDTQPDANGDERLVWVFPIRALKGKNNDIEDEVFKTDETTSSIIRGVYDEEGIDNGEVILIETERPEGSNKPKYKKQSVNAKKTDFLKKTKRDAAIGIRGEELVVLHEKNHLNELGLTDLANQVKWVAQIADGYGYDVLSFDEDGLEKYIEVKTTTIANDKHPFDISANEVKTSDTFKDQYWIYRIYNVEENEPKFYKTNGSISEQFDLVPSSYKAYLK